MGQYFILVNLDKREYICPWCIGGLGKLREWVLNDQVRVFPFLLRKSSQYGGGDIQEAYKFAGRWAGDRIVLIGDYDESGLYHEAFETYRDISKDLVEEFNRFIELDEFKLRYTPCIAHLAQRGELNAQTVRSWLLDRLYFA